MSGMAYEGQSLAGRVDEVVARSESRPEQGMDFSSRYVNDENIGIQRRSTLAVTRRGNMSANFKVIQFFREFFGHG